MFFFFLTIERHLTAGSRTCFAPVFVTNPNDGIIIMEMSRIISKSYLLCVTLLNQMFVRYW